jgi:hypothetical protein
LPKNPTSIGRFAVAPTGFKMNVIIGSALDYLPHNGGNTADVDSFIEIRRGD